MTTVCRAVATSVVLFVASTVLASSGSSEKKPAKPLPQPTFDSVPYGDHPMQKIDVWLPEKGAPTPAIIFSMPLWFVVWQSPLFISLKTM